MMKNLLNSLRTRGYSETLILVIWLVKLRVQSIFTIVFYRLRQYDIAFSTIFFGRVFLQRSTKHSIVIGSRCDIGDNAKIRCYGKGKIILQKRISLGENSIIHAGELVSIGTNVVIGANCYINDTNHRFQKSSTPMIDRGWYANKIIIEDNVWLGANVTVLDGVTIKAGSVIGAGAVVTKDVPANSVYAGVPAKLLYKK